MTITYHAGAARPALELWILDDDGGLIDFSSGYTFTLVIEDDNETALVTKSSGITGAAGSGSEPTGTPNVSVAWTAGELDLTPGAYDLKLTATTSGLPRIFREPFRIAK